MGIEKDHFINSSNSFTNYILHDCSENLFSTKVANLKSYYNSIYSDMTMNNLTSAVRPQKR